MIAIMACAISIYTFTRDFDAYNFFDILIYSSTIWVVRLISHLEPHSSSALSFKINRQMLYLQYIVCYCYIFEVGQAVAIQCAIFYKFKSHSI